jgi:RNA polymerase sigma-70 factor (ECF subfamily)
MLEQTAELLEQRVQETIDRHVINACQQGDREAFRLLFDTYKDRVYSIAVYSLGDHFTAHDVTQQVFVKLMARIGQFRGDSEFSTWLYRLVVNSCMDERRKQKRFTSLEDVAPKQVTEHRQSQESKYARREVSDSVRKAISNLSPKLRLPILLKYIEGLSYEEIAVVLNCSKGTVASRLNRGHKALAKRLGHLRGELIREH